MTEAAAYTTAGVVGAAGAAATRTRPDRPEDWGQMNRNQKKNLKKHHEK